MLSIDAFIDVSQENKWDEKCDLNNNSNNSVSVVGGFEAELCFVDEANFGNLCERSGSTTSSDSGCCVSDEIGKKRPSRVLGGVSGRSKFDTQTTSGSDLNNAWSNIGDNKIKVRRFNFGDDVGFVLRRKLDDLFSSRLVNKIYFGLADGVSANRLRGYDARLFPNALLATCAQVINNCDEITSTDLSKCGEEYLNYSWNEDESLVVVVGEEKNDYFGLDEFWDEDDENNNNDFTHFSNNEHFDEEESVEEINDCAHLMRVLTSAHELVQERKVYGSSTACLLSLEFYEATKYALLSACNLGDSGYMIIRNKQVIFKSQAQSHRYNAPFQLGCTPPELLEHDLYRDRAEDSVCQSHRVKSGDFIVLSSDGLFDNLYEDEIALIIHSHINTKLTATLNDEPTKSCHTSYFGNIGADDEENDDDDENNEQSTPRLTNTLLDSVCDDLVQKASKGFTLNPY